jgi:hypothetical protein
MIIPLIALLSIVSIAWIRSAPIVANDTAIRSICLSIEVVVPLVPRLSIVSIDYIAWIRPHVVTLIAERLCQPITKVTAIRCIALSIEVVVPLVPWL